MPLPSTLLSDLETEARNHLSTGTYIASPRPGGLFLSNPNASMRPASAESYQEVASTLLRE